MTRDEFMEEAQKEIDQVLLTHKNRIMNLVMKAWAEGKKNAEYDRVEELGSEIGEFIKKKMEEATLTRIVIDPPQIDKISVPSTVPLPYKSTTTWCENDIPAGCRNCSNHPINGGSGICHCIVGTQPVMCNSTATDICDAIEKDKVSGVAYDVMTSTGSKSEVNVYNACCDNHIKIIHDMMTGAKTEEEEDGRRTGTR